MPRTPLNSLQLNASVSRVFAFARELRAWTWTNQPTGQSVVIAGQNAPIERDTVGAPAVSYLAIVKLHGYFYSFTLQDPTAAQAQRDLPDFLTFMRSFHYVS